MNSKQLVDLHENEAYLKSRNLVDDRHLPYYIRWLQRFLTGPGGDPSLSAADAHRVFLERLDQSGSVPEWQVRQASRAIELLHLPDTVRSFLAELALKRGVAASTQNQAFCALLFLMREVLGRDTACLSSLRAKSGPHLPVVFSEKIIRRGKGDKDRTTLLPGCIVPLLKAHLDRIREIHQRELAAGRGDVELPYELATKYPRAAWEWAWQYVFPAKGVSVDPRSGAIRRPHLMENVLQRVMKQALVASGIPKHAGVHTLRHAFATHLLMRGVNIREVQEYLGHKSVETTMIYTHVMRSLASSAVSPLDALERGG